MERSDASATETEGKSSPPLSGDEEQQPGESEPVALPPQPTDIHSWLEQLDCQAHLQAFLNAGYDQLPFLHSLERSDYAEIGIDNPQLQTKLAASLMQIDKVKVKCTTHTTINFMSSLILISPFYRPLSFYTS